MVLLSYFSLLTEISSVFFLFAWLVCFILFTHLNPIWTTKDYIHLGIQSPIQVVSHKENLSQFQLRRSLQKIIFLLKTDSFHIIYYDYGFSSLYPHPQLLPLSPPIQIHALSASYQKTNSQTM